MKTLCVIELTYRVPVYAEEGCHVRDAIRMGKEIAGDVDPHDALNLGDQWLHSFDPDSQPFCVEFNGKAIHELIKLQHQKKAKQWQDEMLADTTR